MKILFHLLLFCVFGRCTQGVMQTVTFGDATQYWLGWSVDMDGLHIVAGAPYANNQEGGVHIYTESGIGNHDWLDDHTALYKTGQDGFFGYSVAIKDLTLVVGAPGDSSTSNLAAVSGGVFIFHETSQGSKDWASNEAFISASDGHVDDRYGHRVSFHGPLLVVGAFYHDMPVSQAGAAYVYEEVTGGMSDFGPVSAETKLTHPSLEIGDDLGYMVLVDEERDVFVNCLDCTTPITHSAGTIVIYTETIDGASDWAMTYEIFATYGAQWWMNFGQSFAKEGTTLVVGCTKQKPDRLPYVAGAQAAGAAYIYRESAVGAHDWMNSEEYFVAFDLDYIEGFGGAVAFDHLAGKMAISAPGYKGCSGVSTGAVYYFQESTVGADDWVMHSNTLNISMYDPVDPPNARLGYTQGALAMQNNVIVAGAPDTGSSAGWGGTIYIFTPCNSDPLNPQYTNCDCAAEGQSGVGLFCNEACQNGGEPGALDDVTTCDGTVSSCDCTGTNATGTHCQTVCANGALNVDGTGCDCTGLNAVGATCNKLCNNGIADETFTTCNCTGSGAEGKYCHQDVDDCASNPCSHGGTCTDNGDSLFPDHANEFNCSCVQPWMGTTCNDTLCYSSPCLNNGLCENGVDFACNCNDTGFAGEYCETEIDECHSSPCLNDGVCTDLVNGFSCICEPGFFGDDCGSDVDDCVSMPCQNDGTCNDDVNSYECVCVNGWTGFQCTDDVDDCASSPCQHGGACTDVGLNAYVCECADTGYTGLVCQTDVDDCASYPCQNDGTCTDGGFNAFTCDCSALYTGIVCEELTATDPCLSAPCTLPKECVAFPDWTGYDCVGEVTACLSETKVCDDSLMDCDDDNAIATWMVEQLVMEQGGSAADYDVVVTSSGPPNRRVFQGCITYTDPNNEYLDANEFFEAIENSAGVAVLRGDDGSWTSSGNDASTHTLCLFGAVVTLLLTFFFTK